MEGKVFLAVGVVIFCVCTAYGEDSPALSGTVSSSDGKPLAGVRVDVSTAGPKVGAGIFCPSCYLDCGKFTTTDPQGQFTIPKLDPTLKFHLVLTKPGYRSLQTAWMDPANGPASLTLESLPAAIDQNRVVSGIVTLDGVPVAGALVDPHGAKTVKRRWWGQVDGVDPTVTDEAGRFSMILPDDFLALDIRITGFGFCGEQVDQMTPGMAPKSIEVKQGASVVGKIESHGEPMAKMSIAVVQLERGTQDGIFIAAVGDVTDEAGRFEFHNLPPDERYGIYSVVGEANRSHSPQVISTKTFLAPSTDQVRDLGTLDIAPSYSISGRVERINGQPLPKNLKLSFSRDPAWDLVSVVVADDGTFRIEGLPSETYEIRVGDRRIVVAGDQIPYQMLSEASFGVRLQDSIDGLVIPLEGK